MSEDHQSSIKIFRRLLKKGDIFAWLAFIAVCAFVILSIVNMGLFAAIQVDRIRNKENSIVIHPNNNGNGEYIEINALIKQMEEIEKRADSAVASTELILSFLQGATVLLGIGLGAAAIYGFNQVSDIRDSLQSDAKKETENIKNLTENVTTELKQLDSIREFIRDNRQEIAMLPEVIKLSEQLEQLGQELKTQKLELENRVENVTWLLQANQEFGLNNREQAYAFAVHVLKNDDRNPLALYIAGWLEGIYRNDLDTSLKRFKKLINLLEEKEWNWGTAQAAHAVILRKRGRGLTKNAETEVLGENDMSNALVILEEVLRKDSSLTDLSNESFWGPVGGIYRDLEKWEKAITAYKNALDITPRSSYPQGNLAALTLRVACINDNEEKLAEAFQAFEKTIEYAKAELLLNPDNYYLLMDLAMPHIILNKVIDGKDSIPSGQEYFKQAMSTNPELQPMKTTQTSGWQFLLDSCPEEWTEVRSAIQEIIADMQKVIDKKQAEEEAKKKAESEQNTESDDAAPHQS